MTALAGTLLAPLTSAAGNTWAVLLLGGRVNARWSAATLATLQAGAAMLGTSLALHLELRERERQDSAVRALAAGLERRVADRTRELEAARRAAENAARTDPLTRIGNRRAFDADLDTAATRARLVNAGFAVLTIDLDNLKAVNDRDGHERGDALLLSFASRLQAGLRDDDRLYRVGGDEFSAVLPGTGREGFGAVRERVEQALILVRADGFASANASLGLAAFPFEAGAPGELVRLADRRMYEDKARHRVETHGPAHEGAGDPRAIRGGEISARALAGTLSLLARDQEPTDEVWARLLEAAVASVTGAEAGSLHMREGDTFRVRAQVGYEPGLVGITEPYAAGVAWHGLSEQDWRAGVPRVITGLEILERSRSVLELHSSGELLPQYETSGSLRALQANLVIPVVVDGQVIAHFNLDSFSSEEVFGPLDIRLAEQFAAQVAAVFTARERRAAETRLQERLSAALSDSRDAFVAQETALRVIRESLNASGAYHALNGARLQPAAPRPGDGGPPAWTDQAAEDIAAGREVSLPEHRLATRVASTRGEALGVLTLWRDAPFPGEAAGLLAGASATLGATVERLRAVQEAAERASRLELLMDLSRLALSARDVTGAATVVLQRLAGVLDAQGGVYLEAAGEGGAASYRLRAVVGLLPALKPSFSLQNLSLNGLPRDLPALLEVGASNGVVLLAAASQSSSQDIFEHPEAVAVAAVALRAPAPEDPGLAAHDAPHGSAHGAPLDAALFLYARGPRDWSPADESLLHAVHANFSSLLGRLRAAERAQVALREQAQAAELTRRLEGLSGAHSVVQAALQAERGLFGATLAVISDASLSELPLELRAAAAALLDRGGGVNDAPAGEPPLDPVVRAVEAHSPAGKTGLGAAVSFAGPGSAAGYSSLAVRPLAAGDILAVAWTGAARPERAAWATCALAGFINRAREREAAREATLAGVTAALEARGIETRAHQKRLLANLAPLVSRLRLSDELREALNLAARLYDLPLLAAPDKLLLKPTPLDAAERVRLQAAVKAGLGLLDAIPGLPEETVRAVRSRHERWDGRGYPLGLAGEAISLPGRVLAVAQAYGELRAPGSRRPALSASEAAAALRSLSGAVLDPALTETFLEELGARED